MTNAIEIESLGVTFRAPGGGEVMALDGVDLAVAPGRIVGFLGPNGAGKTTTLQVLLGFLAPTRGAARVLGLPCQAPKARERVGYLPERARWYPFLTGRELLVGFARLFGFPRRAAADRAEALLAEVGLAEAADRRLGAYSRGMAQRFGLAQALVQEPDLLILDEPTSGLDPLGRMAVRAVIQRQRERGAAVFFSSHELSEVERVCDEVAMLVRGRVRARGRAADLAQPGESLERCFLRVVEAAEGGA